jgi:SAM-dependent methyltransferase
MRVSQDLTYDRPRETRDDLHPEHQKVLEWAGQKKRVLELGCHTGNLSRWLQAQGCHVVGVELNAAALDRARPFLVDAHNANLEDEALWRALAVHRFDIVLAMHVLEHLIDPWAALRRIVDVLADDGELIVGLPNVCSAASRFDILCGRFRYSKTGVMDKTHLRFFDQVSARELLVTGGFEVCEYFGPEQEKPHALVTSKLPFLWRLGPLVSRIPNSALGFSPNLTDTVMDFRCRKASSASGSGAA